MLRYLSILLVMFLIVGIVNAAEDRATKVRNDKERIKAEGFWIYNDFDKGVEEAKNTGKPMLVVFRCIPCEACSGFDARVADRDEQVNDLMEQFVCVRIIKTNGMDLSLFQFDYDLSFAAFFMNADKTIYGRFGSRSEREDPEKDISINGFRKALRAALEVHKDYPNNKTLLAGKQPQPVEIAAPELYPSLKGRYTSMLDYEGNVVRSCIHCHQIRDAERQMYRTEQRVISDKVMYPWPMPDVVGLSLSAGEKATVESVVPGSTAARAGFMPGDEILTLGGQLLLSIADVQWILHNAVPSATLEAKVTRDGQQITLTLVLDEDWRQHSDISWRVTTWDLRRMALGGMVLGDLPDADRQEAGLSDDGMALRVDHVGQYGEHAVAKNAGFQKGDILVNFDGQNGRMTESNLIAYALRNHAPGDKVIASALRGTERVQMELLMQ